VAKKQNTQNAQRAQKAQRSQNSQKQKGNQNSQNAQNMKYEIANELGVNLKDGYNGELTSREAGYVGGNMVKRMIEQVERSHSK
jgi:hypothetical protein